MILVCPSCDTRYFADDSAVGKDGRRVRCASCGHSWFAKIEEEGSPAPVENTGLTREQVERLRQTAAANSAARAGPHAEFRAREHARRKRERTRAIAIAWISGFVVFAGGVAAAAIFRNDVTGAFPKAASIYRVVGLDVNRFGLVLEDVKPKRSFEGTTPVVTVTGLVVNQSDERRDAPLLRVVLRDEDGRTVQEWTDQITVPALGPGERVEFSTQSEAPPIEAYRVTVTFAPKPGPSGVDRAPGPSPDANQGEPAGIEGAETVAHDEELDWNGGEAEEARAQPASEETDHH